MNSKSIIALSVIAVVLLSGSFVSMAAAEDDIGSATHDPSAPDESRAPEPTADPGDEPTSGDEILYTIQDNSTDSDRDLAPEDQAAEGNLIATQTPPDYTVPIVIIAVVAAVLVGGAIGVFYYTKNPTASKNFCFQSPLFFCSSHSLFGLW
jgi:hypothetical protein